MLERIAALYQVQSDFELNTNDNRVRVYEGLHTIAIFGPTDYVRREALTRLNGNSVPMRLFNTYQTYKDSFLKHRELFGKLTSVEVDKRITGQEFTTY